MPDVLRVYPAYIKGSAEEVLVIDQQFLKVWAAIGDSRTKVINKIFQAGLETLMESDELEGQIDKTGFNIYRKMQEVNSRLMQKNNLEFLYEHLELDEFIQFCDSNKLDHETFLIDYRAAPPSRQARSKIINDWLKWRLADGEYHPVVEIREAMIEQDVIINNDWDYVKNIASREGYSNNDKRGHWKI